MVYYICYLRDPFSASLLTPFWLEIINHTRNYNVYCDRLEIIKTTYEIIHFATKTMLFERKHMSPGKHQNSYGLSSFVCPCEALKLTLMLQNQWELSHILVWSQWMRPARPPQEPQVPPRIPQGHPRNSQCLPKSPQELSETLFKGQTLYKQKLPINRRAAGML
jgi:hypothetical protein